MKRSAATIRPLLLLSGAALAILTLLLWSGGGEQTARANPDLTVGVDLNYSTPGTYERCLSISGTGVTFDVDIFVLDIVDLMAFSADVEYDSSVVDVIDVEVDHFLGSSAVDVSSWTPGYFRAAAFDDDNQGHNGSGVLARLTLDAVGEGASPFDLNLDPATYHGVLLQDPASPPNPIGDTNGDTWFDGPFINAQTTIAVGASGLTDTDGDTVPDGCDNCPISYNPSQANNDGDDMGDTCDPDDDNDGIPDFTPPGPDNCRLIPNPFDADGDGPDGEDPLDGIDNDSDTLVDEDHETGQEDWNNDNQGDVCDDTDGDGVMDYPDNCRSDPNTDQANMDGDGLGDVCDPDKDGDGWDNGPDNCPDAYNPGQADRNDNGIGDACDDPDTDGVVDDGDASGVVGDNPCAPGETENCDDNCPDTSNPGQDDNDTDGLGNPCDNCQSVPNPPDADDDGQDGEDPVDGIDNDSDTLVDEDHEIGQENKDDDALGDACDWDDDNDSICDPGKTSPFCSGSDNCRLIKNGPSQSGIQCVGNQTDTDLDGLGDPCDPDADADRFSKAEENQWGSKDCQASSVPEVCDGTDNDKDGSTDEGWGDPPTPFADIDSDTVPDCDDGTDNRDGSPLDTDGDTIVNPSDPDIDGDSTSNEDEHKIPTDACVFCDDGTGYPDWPPDFDNNFQVNILDIVQLTPPVFNSEWPDPVYSKRKDLNSDGYINILDIVRLTPPVFNTNCTP